MKFQQRQVADAAAQENFEQLASMFPLGISDLATGIVLELAVAGTRRKVAFGTSALTWPGGSAFTNTLTLAHGLGAAPVMQVATTSLAAGSDPCLIHYVTVDATNIQWRGYDAAGLSPAAATTKPFAWMAVA